MKSNKLANTISNPTPQLNKIIKPILKEVNKHEVSLSKYARRFEKNNKDFSLFGSLPIFISQDHQTDITNKTWKLRNLLISVPFRAFNGDIDKTSKLINLKPKEMKILKKASYSQWDALTEHTFARPDAFIHGSLYKIIEANITTAIGGYERVDKVNQHFLKHPVLKPLFQDKILQIDSFIDKAAEHVSTRISPNENLGLLEVFYKNFPDHLGDYCVKELIERFSKLGVNAYSLDPRNFKFKNNKVYAGKVRIDTIMKTIISENVIKDYSKHLTDAGHFGSTKLIGDLWDIIFWNKGLLAIISDNKMNHFLTKEEKDLVKDVIPWTRFLSNDLDKKPVPSITNKITKSKDKYIIKRSDSWLSRNVHSGINYTKKEWIEIVDKASKEGGWIIQEFIEPDFLQMLHYHEGHQEIFETNSVISPYTFEGDIYGFLCIINGMASTTNMGIVEDSGVNSVIKVNI